MQLHKLKRGDKFTIVGGLGNVFTFIGISGLPNDIFYACYKDRDGQMQYFIGSMEVTKTNR